VDNDLVKRLMWSGLLAGLGALFSIVSSRSSVPSSAKYDD